MFFDTQVYIQFVKDCRAAGILCPVVPGIMCLTGKAGFYKMAQFCKTRVPPELAERVAACTTDDDVKALGIRWGTQQCRDMMAIPEKELVPSVLHFYTLNLEKVVLGILGELGLVEKNDGNHAGHDDATAGVAAGSAWARIGDAVDSVYGRGTVVEFVQETAVIRIDSWKLAGDQAPIAYLQNGHYHKVVFSN